MASEPVAVGTSHAVLIGVADYQDPAVPNVPAALNSLRAMDALLKDPELCGWPTDAITVIPDPRDPAEVAVRLRRIAEETSDTFLVYFVGHGFTTETGELCLATGNTLRLDADLTSLEYEKVRRILIGCKAQVKLVILDCCHAGRAIQTLSPADENQLAAAADIRGAYTLTAADQAAHLPPPEQQRDACTSFTETLCDVVRLGVPGGPAGLALSEIYWELRRELKARGLPEANQRGTDTVGLHVFSRNRAYYAPPSAGRAFPMVAPNYPELLLEALAKEPLYELSTQSLDDLGKTAGVYELHYSPPGIGSQLVYIGKAEQSLHDRLRQHMRKIDGRLNIETRHMRFRCLEMADDLSYLAPEQLLLKLFVAEGHEVPWARNGFGNKDPGRARDRTAPAASAFDALYPIDLSYQVNLDGFAEETTAREFANRLKGRLPFGFRCSPYEGKFDEIPATFPDGPVSADEAFRLLARYAGKDWQITALAGYVVMYEERYTDYPQAQRYYFGSETRNPEPRS
jgi:hypothetical protein